jgi:regulator of cell morphogenesis and NO signaling
MNTTTVSEMAAGSLAAVRVFEKFGINYCCGGKRPLVEICREKGLEVAEVEGALAEALADGSAAERDWMTEPVPELIEHILATHHAYLERELPAIQVRLDKVYRVYNQRYGPTLLGLPEVFGALRAELEMHVRKEEMILFPAVLANDAALGAGRALPPSPFGTVANPIRMMEAEHDNASEALERIREITSTFAVPPYACVTYRALMAGLSELDADLRQHMHLENDVLFPKARRMEF